MEVLAMGNVGKAIIPVVKVRYICFYFMFLYSLALFISLPKCGPEEEQKVMRGKNSIVKHLKWNLIITQSHHPYITLLPRWDLWNTQKHQVLFLLTGGMKCDFFRKKSSVLRNLQSAVPSSPSPHSQCLSQYGLAGLGPKLKGSHLPPSHTPDPALPSLPIIRKTDRHIFLWLVDTLIINN